MGQLATKPQNTPILVDSQLQVPFLVALLMRGDKILAPVLNLESVKQHGRSATTILAGQRGSCRWLSGHI
jgi:hypothetical protein